MDTLSSTCPGTLNLILNQLGFPLEQHEDTLPTEGYRLEFESNFVLELHGLGDRTCRLSTRIVSLGKSLQVQENQIKAMLGIFSELMQDLPPSVSPAISNHDNCLRLCREINSQDVEEAMRQFQEFVELAFAFQQTCFRQSKLDGKSN